MSVQRNLRANRRSQLDSYLSSPNTRFWEVWSCLRTDLHTKNTGTKTASPTTHEGSIRYIIVPAAPGSQFQAFLISNSSSCLSVPDAFNLNRSPVARSSRRHFRQ
jgi:hypothetical protein